MSSHIDQEVIDELIAMLEDHITGGLKKPEDAEAPASDIPGVEGSPAEEAAESPEMEASEGAEHPAAAKSPEDDEDMKALMEMYSRG